MVVMAVIGYIALMVVSSILNGYALSVLWGGFIVLVFDLPALAIAPAIGLAMVISFLTHQYNEYTDKEKSAKERMVISIVVSILKPLLVLLFGWVVHQFM